MLVPASLPVLDLLSAFDSQSFLFVLDASQLTHVVTSDYIDREPAKLAVFALLMELEGLLLRQLVEDTTEEARSAQLARLSAGRLQKAQDLCKAQNGRVMAYGTILATTFIDRATMVLKDPVLFEQLSFESMNQTRSFFNRAQTVRNQIAHGLDISSIVGSPRELKSFLAEVDSVVVDLQRIRRMTHETA